MHLFAAPRATAADPAAGFQLSSLRHGGVTTKDGFRSTHDSKKNIFKNVYLTEEPLTGRAYA